MWTVIMLGPRVSTVVVVALFATFLPTASAQNLVTNGSFESGFANWTRTDQVGSNGTFLIQSGTTSPINGFTVPPPSAGVSTAMTDTQGPGTHVLYQDFTVPSFAIQSAHLRFDLYIGNRATAFSVPSPATLDFSTPTLNQQARVDFISPTVDPFGVNATDILFNAYKSSVGDPLVSGYNTIDTDVTSLLTSNAGNTLRLRFSEVDNVNFYNLGVDNVFVTVVPVAEPKLIICAIAILLICIRQIRQAAS